jgi:hypothetical protein
MLCLSYCLLCFLVNKIGEQQGRTGSAQKPCGRGRDGPKMYTHVSNCKTNKIKKIIMLATENGRVGSFRVQFLQGNHC